MKVTCNTAHIEPGCTFVAIPGYQTNGAQFISQAIGQGATTIVHEDEYDASPFPDVSFIRVQNARITLAEHAAAAYHKPSSQLNIIGITGTKGKTTTAYLIEHMLKAAGCKTALLGTIVNRIGDTAYKSDLTSPNSDYLHWFFDQCVQQGITHVVMEVSAHALSLHRVHGIAFAAVGFTNLAPEHLDFYENMENYFAAKAKIFEQIAPGGCAVINTDDMWGQRALELVTRSVKPFETVSASSTSSGRTGINIIPLTIQSTKTQACATLPGPFNQYNIAMAAHICAHVLTAVRPEEVEGRLEGSNRTAQVIKQTLATFPGVPGRLQCHTLQNGARAFVDYAHNPSSMENVLRTLRPMTPHLIVIFGCGGDRDRTKRTVMGQISAQHADIIIITDDNPRSEDHNAIIQEIYKGIGSGKKEYVRCIPDRKKAIAHAVSVSQKDSIIAVLGKGHETYYEVNGKRLHCDDWQEVTQF